MRSPRSIIGALLLTALAAAAPAGTEPAVTTATPLFALWHHAFDVPLENDAPQVVIYEDGTVIARRRGASATSSGRTGAPAPGFMLKRLSLAQLGPWYDDVGAILRHEELKTVYTVAIGSRAPTAAFYFQAGQRGVFIRVRGLSDAALSPFGSLLNLDAEEVPARLLRVFQDARRLNLDGAVAWNPPSVEVRLIPSPTPVANARAWPASWPPPPTDAGSSTTGFAALRLNGAETGVARFIQQPGWYPFTVDGTTRLAWFRPVFPGEALWRREIESDAEQARATLAESARQQLDAQRGQVRDALQERVDAGTSRPPEVPSITANARVQPPPIDRPDIKLDPYPIAPPVPNGKMKSR
ncbi:MAG: hypothetical protein Q7S40_25975 [Opitutaceae bacterium]|nr:hypothetical protein [Opitutaceae bacterium]